MKKSGFLSLNWLDFGKGFLVALLAFLLNFAQESIIPALQIPLEVKTLLYAGIAYLFKNFFEGEKRSSSRSGCS